MKTKQILGKIYSFQFLGIQPKDEEGQLVHASFFENEVIRAHVSNFEKLGLLTRDNDGSMKLTERGRKKIVVVMTGGSFDIIHPGHVETLEKAKSLGDVLIVSVARNVTYLRNKKKNPLYDEVLRRKMVSSIKFVDAAILGSEIDIFETVKLLRPDKIALGYDQAHSESAIKEELAKRGLDAEVVRLDSSVPSIKSSKIAQDYY